MEDTRGVVRVCACVCMCVCASWGFAALFKAYTRLCAFQYWPTVFSERSLDSPHNFGTFNICTGSEPAYETLLVLSGAQLQHLDPYKEILIW